MGAYIPVLQRSIEDERQVSSLQAIYEYNGHRFDDYIAMLEQRIAEGAHAQADEKSGGGGAASPCGRSAVQLPRAIHDN